MRGLLITLEGGEGVGKSTQLASLAGRLEGLGRSVIITLEPGGTALGLRIRELLVRSSEVHPSSLCELFLYAADRAEHVSRVIGPGLAAGSVVLCDRYADATEAYQGYGRGLPLEAVRQINGAATGGVLPDRTVVLDLDPGVGVRRSLERQGRGQGPAEARFEEESAAFHERVRAGYRAIAQSQPERVRIVDARGTPDEVGERIWAELADLF